MDNLYNYLGKNIILIDTDGKQWNGKVDMFDSAEDNDTGEDSIVILCDDNPNQLVEFMQSEIKEIEVISEKVF